MAKVKEPEQMYEEGYFECCFGDKNIFHASVFSVPI